MASCAICGAAQHDSLGRCLRCGQAHWSARGWASAAGEEAARAGPAAQTNQSYGWPEPLASSAAGLIGQPPPPPLAVVPRSYPHHNHPQPQDSDPDDDLWMRTMCNYVIRDMHRYGICVIDNFAGTETGDAVLHEVASLYSEGVFEDGEVMSGPLGGGAVDGVGVGLGGGASFVTVRGDKIVWVDGHEPPCAAIGRLIQLVDAVVINSNKMRRCNGKLGQYNISDRSRAMVACYPGGGTQYLKHVDNPNRDGRCITCIYYLNKDWDVQRDGGLLRIFPQDRGLEMSVADIEPDFDRILLFWSDRRNPHEVQPALRTRYAITLWYYDKDEAEAAQKLELEAQRIHGDANDAGSSF